MPKIKYTGKFWGTYRRLIARDPEIEGAVESRLKLFAKNFADTRLKNHSLKRDMVGKFAFSINSDIRVVYEWTSQTTVKLLAIGNHKEAYHLK
jgi:mRNA-degrading endonuclease YafQ of YafQ-DinJ toxin-antitoxin module